MSTNQPWNNLFLCNTPNLFISETMAITTILFLLLMHTAMAMDDDRIKGPEFTTDMAQSKDAIVIKEDSPHTSVSTEMHNVVDEEVEGDNDDDDEAKNGPPLCDESECSNPQTVIQMDTEGLQIQGSEWSMYQNLDYL